MERYTLTDFARDINSLAWWELDASAIIVANGWKEGKNEVICESDTEELYWNEDLVAMVRPK